MCFVCCLCVHTLGEDVSRFLLNVDRFNIVVCWPGKYTRMETTVVGTTGVCAVKIFAVTKFQVVTQTSTMQNWHVSAVICYFGQMT